MKRKIIATLGLFISASLLSVAPASAAELEGTPSAEYIAEHGLEKRSDGLYYAPGDESPTIDPFEVESSEPTITPYISPVTCNGKLEYYRIVSTSNAWTCFANKGTYSKVFGNWNNIKGHCPGKNTGRIHYFHSGYGYWAWTIKRAGTSNLSKCYWFENNQSFAVNKVQID